MIQEPVVESLERRINYPLALIGAVGGAAIGIAIWAAAAAFSNSFYYVTPVFIGAFAGGGAARLGGKGHISLAILGLIIGTIGIVLGDFAESAAIAGRLDFTVKDLIEIMQFKIEDDTIRGILYLVGIGAAFFSGFYEQEKDKKEKTSQL